jgi:hypothetical protein
LVAIVVAFLVFSIYRTRGNWNDWGLLRFFGKVGFVPAKALNLELEP